MKWVLIFYVFGPSIQPIAHEFGSLKACNDARTVLVASVKGSRGFCFPLD